MKATIENYRMLGKKIEEIEEIINEMHFVNRMILRLESLNTEKRFEKNSDNNFIFISKISLNELKNKLNFLSKELQELLERYLKEGQKWKNLERKNSLKK